MNDTVFTVWRTDMRIPRIRRRAAGSRTTTATGAGAPTTGTSCRLNQLWTALKWVVPTWGIIGILYLIFSWGIQWILWWGFCGLVIAIASVLGGWKWGLGMAAVVTVVCCEAIAHFIGVVWSAGAIILGIAGLAWLGVRFVRTLCTGK